MKKHIMKMKGDLTPGSSGLLCCSFVFISDWPKHSLSLLTLVYIYLYSLILRDDDHLICQYHNMTLRDDFILTMTDLNILSPPSILSFASCFPV